MNAPSIGFLRKGKAKAWVVGPMDARRAAVVQWDDMPEEPVGFGTDEEALFQPTWSTGVGNPASMRVVEKLGFVEVLPRRCYVGTERVS